MFLNYLSKENKERFLNLCVHAALSNGAVENEEKEMIVAYCREMDIPEHIPEVSGSVEEALDDFIKNSSEVEKKIVLIELLALVKADNLYDENEKAFMEKIADSMDIKAGILDKINSLLEIYNTVCMELFTTVMG